MKSLVHWLGSAIAALLLASGAIAQQTGQDATIKSPTAEVRGNRSELFPVTSVLRQGQPVRILREEDGYYAITPPSGSSSWIKDRALKHVDTPRPGRVSSAMVLIDDVPVRLGSERASGPLQFETVKLKRGTIVRVLGEKAFAEGEEWWRIQPPPAEVRYVLKDAVTQPTSITVSASPQTGASPATLPNQPSHPLWLQAEAAYRQRDFGRADLLFRQLAAEMAQPGGDHDLAIRCYNRIEQLSRTNPATWPARTQAPGMLVSSARPPSTSGNGSTTANPIGTIATGPGWLRRSNVQIDGRAAYVLEDNRGQPKYYLLPNSGVNFEPYLNRPVELFGMQMQRSDLVGGGYLAVSRLHLLR